MARILVGLLLAILVILQYRLWVGDGSLAEVHGLKLEIEQQRQLLERLNQRNSALQAEVMDLKTGLKAIEERARSELGMIRDNEVFYQVVEPEGGAEQ